MRFRTFLRYRRRRAKAVAGPAFRPWALAVPIGVLLICLPLLRPLRHAEPAADEAVRLATVQSLLDNHSLALPRSAIEIGDEDSLVRIKGKVFADQPPTMAVLLVGPTWIMRKMGWDLRTDPEAVAYMLTLLAVTLPVAATAGLLYRMARLFELSRRWRALVALTGVAGSGLLSYAVVLNAQAPAAALLIAAASCLVRVQSSQRPRYMSGWIMVAGFCAMLAVALDPIAALVAIPLVLVIACTRFSLRFRIGGVFLLILGALPVVAVHSAFNVQITGDVIPVTLHRDVPGHSHAALSITPVQEEDSDDVIAPPGAWASFQASCDWLTTALVGSHGLLTHFPILLLGVGGVGAVMHRHWPTPIKVLAGASLLSAVIAMTLFCWIKRDWIDADFALSWFIPLLPLLMFWAGAWARRSHGRFAWSLAGTMLGWSVLVSVLGATNPIPRGGYDSFTALQAMQRLIHPGPLPADAVAGR